MDLAGWSKKDLAGRAGLDQSAVGRLLSGELQIGDRSIPGLIYAVRDRFGDTVHTCNLFEMIAPDGTAMSCLCSLVEHLAAVVPVIADADEGAAGAAS
jgi:transcriptional regulator with XRE-family HTH domain